MAADRSTIVLPMLLTLVVALPLAEGGGGWVSEALAEAMSGFSPSSATNPQCSLDGDLYRRALDNQTLWAVTMLDASSGWAGGLLTGDAYSLGHFDQCVSVKTPLRARHCLASLTFGPLPSHHPAFYRRPPNATYWEPSPYASVWDKIKVTSDPNMSRRDRFHWAVCVPHSCDARDVRRSLNASLAPALAKRGLRGEVGVDPDHCHGTDPDTDADVHDGGNDGYVAVRMTILLAVLLSAIATIYDYVISYYREEKIESLLVEKSEKLLLAFSMRKNMAELTEKGANPKLDVVNGGKVVSMAALLFGHRALYSHGLSLQNHQYWETRMDNFGDSALMNATHLVDVFFVCSGYLAFLGIHKAMEKTKSLNFPLVFLLRWLRIVPAYLLMMAIYGWLLPRLADGPLWTGRVGLEAERCRANWWLNLLFINNYVHADSQCLLFSWYLACDMQFFVVGMFAIYVLIRWPKVGYGLFALLLALSIAVPFYVTYDGKFPGILRLYASSLLRDPPSNEQYTTVYVKSHNRAGPYILGVLTGFLGVRLAAANFKFTKSTILLGFLLLFGGGYAHQFYGFFFYQKGREYGWLENALYASLHRITFGLGVGWIMLTYYTTGFGLFRACLAQPIYTPLSRLAFCLLLVHPAVQLAEASSVRHTEFMTYHKMFWMACGDYLMSTLAALPLYLMVEAPCRTLVKVLFLDRRPVRVTPNRSSSSSHVAYPGKFPEDTQHYTAEQQKQAVVISRL